MFGEQESSAVFETEKRSKVFVTEIRRSLTVSIYLYTIRNYRRADVVVKDHYRME